jgi:eukaryotic-like serine/threonine-protein kinase
MADRTGQQLGHYRLIRLLGRGGFAEVYLGEHLHLKTQAAIKVLYTALEEEDIESFLREAQTVARLKHPHIVRVFDFDVQDHTPYLVMDYLPNGNVRRSCPKGKVLPLETIISYVNQVASALQYAHDQKVIHRDVKPENMLLDRDNSVVLSDFGIALMAQSSRYQSAQEVAGTAAYMAPEQFQGHPHRASDQYALGVVVYEWLSGDKPFHGTFSEIASQHLFVPPPALSEKVPTISSAIEQVIRTALEKDPQKRFRSVIDLATALKHACSAMPPQQVALTTEASLLSEPSLPSQASPIVLPTQSPQTANIITPSGKASLLTETVCSPNQSLPSTVAITSSNTHDMLPPSRTLAKRNISRRKVIIGLISLVGLAGTGGAAWVLLSPKPLYIYHGHSSMVRDVAWSPDGIRIASASDDGTVQVWDATTGGNVINYRDQSSGVYRVDWSPDGKHIVSGGYDTTARVWDVTSGNTIFVYRGHSGIVYAVSWSPDGTRIASGGNDNTIQVWDATTGNHVSIFHGHSTYYPAIYEVAWSPDGKYIASVDNFETVHIWHADTGNDVFVYHANDQVWTGVWSPNGKYIAFADSVGIVEVVDTSNWSTIYAYHGHSSTLAYGHSVTWSPDSLRIASADDHEMHVWDATSGNNLYIYRGKFSYAIKWSPDGKFIASIAGNNQNFFTFFAGYPDETVEVWQAP